MSFPLLSFVNRVFGLRLNTLSMDSKKLEIREIYPESMAEIQSTLKLRVSTN